MAENTTPDIEIVCAFRQVIDTVVHENTNNIKFDAITEHHPSAQRGVWNKGEVTFYVKGEVDELFQDRINFMKRVFNAAATEWDIEIALQFTQVYTEEEADIIIEWGARKNDRYYSGDKGKNVLGYAGYPNGSLKGYMKLFTDWDWLVSGGLNILTVIIHELGHIIGRPHSERRLWIDIMDPMINAAVTELSEFDIEGGILGYGARVYSHDHRHDMLEKANRKAKLRLQKEEIPTIKAHQ